MWVAVGGVARTRQGGGEVLLHATQISQNGSKGLTMCVKSGMFGVLRQSRDVLVKNNRCVGLIPVEAG